MLTSLVRQWLGRRNSRRAARWRTEGLAAGIERERAGDLAGAESAYRALIAASPHDAQALHLLGHVLALQGRAEEAVETLARAAALAPGDPELRFNLAQALGASGRPREAEEELRAALRLRPRFGAAQLALGDLLALADRVDEAEECYRAALELEPERAEAHYNYGNLLHRTGRIGEAIERYRRALELKPDFARAHSNLVYALNFSAAYSPEAIWREHREWARRHAARFAREIRPHPNSLRTDRVLRVGYVSPNFRDHAVSCFFEPTLRHHDRERIAVFCYSDVRRPDATTERLRAYPCTWRDTAQLDDEGLAELVRADAIDILVDLTGHTDGHRLLLFARKPAPVQVTWNGYANTTGLDTMDYRITDPHADPPGLTDHLHSERLVRLPEVYMAFEPPAASPEVAAAPVLRNGYVTFGSFNALAKIGPQVIRVWARLLAAVPGARLLVLTVPEGRTRARLLEAFAACGVEPGRIELRPRLPFAQFLAEHARADIALDPFPFCGTTTTCQTLWMGVPVITLAGRTHVSRVGASLLANAGLPELVARDEQDYVARAATLAADPARLQQLRAGLRERLARSPVTDGARHTRYLERAYATMWENHCRASGAQEGASVP